MNLPLRSYWALLNRYLHPQRGRVLWLATVLLVKIALTLINPQIMRSFIDDALAGGDQGSLIQTAVLFLIVAFASQGITVLTSYLSEQTAWSATNALRVDLVEHCLSLDRTFHNAHTPGELLERIDGDVSKLTNFFTQFVVNIIANTLLLIGVMLLLFREDWRASMAIALYVIVALAILLRLSSIATPYWQEWRQQNALFYGFLGEQLSGIEDLKANGGIPYAMRRFRQMSRNLLHVQMQTMMRGLWVPTLGIFSVGTMLAFGVGGYLWSIGAISVGTIFLILRYTDLIGQPITQIKDELTHLQEADASIQRIQALLKTPSRLQNSHGVLLPAGPLAVQFENVSFAYEAQDNALTQLHFTLQAGEVLGLLGRTGSGKSTVARLLLRLHDPSSGEIRLGSCSTVDCDVRLLRQRVGIVSQDVQLFHASVRDNLTFFDPAIPDQRLHGVLEELGLDGWLRTLPHGINTELAPGALSAGEAQLLAFARIFLRDPGLVILDEASSRLDPATEQWIERAVSKLLHNRTALLIAHRLATVQRADHILILEQGSILEYGPRATLAADPNSRFSQMLRVGLAEILV